MSLVCTVEITNENYIYQPNLSAVNQPQVSWSVKRLNSAHERQKRQEEEFIQTVVLLWWVESVSVFCSAIFNVYRQSDCSFWRKASTKRFAKVRESFASSQQNAVYSSRFISGGFFFISPSSF